jgi:hypothetical protein
MTVLQTRNTIFAVTKEVTEGTPVAPTTGTDFVAFQEGFSVEPSFTELTNAELQSSIDMPKPALGFEEPSASVSHYLRHSGVEGQEPNFKHLLESCLGSKNVNATERVTAAASTTSVVKLTAGGADFSRGRAILLKDGVNGYAIRNVLTVSTNDLNLAQNLSAAPAAGVSTGKCVTYAVTNDSHPTIDIWVYRANSGAVEMLAGGRVVDMTIDIAAGEFINTSFTIEGIKYYFDPFVIGATNKYIDFDDGGGEENASIAEGTYRDPYELAEAIRIAMQALTTDVIGVSYSDSLRKFTITSDGATFSLLWATGANTANSIKTTIGFSNTDDTAALTYSSDTALSWASTISPTYDSASPLVAKDNQIMIGNATEYVCFGARSVSIALTNTKADKTDICAASGKSGTIFTQREVTIDVVSYLAAGQAEEFKRFRSNDEIMFTYNFGEKNGGQWVAGKSGNIFCPTVKIASFSIGDEDGMCVLNMQLKTFVSNGLGTFYLNFL